MAEIHINRDNLLEIIKSYKEVNNTFAFRSFTGNDSQKECKCYINGCSFAQRMRILHFGC